MNKDIPLQTGEGPDSFFSLRDFLTIFFKHKGKIIFVFFATFLSVAIATLLMTPIYETYSSFLVKMGREHIYRPEVGTENPTIDNDRRSREATLQSELKIASSPDLIQQVLENLTVKKVYPAIAADPPENGSLLVNALNVVSLKYLDVLTAEQMLLFTSALNVILQGRIRRNSWLQLLLL